MVSIVRAQRHRAEHHQQAREPAGHSQQALSRRQLLGAAGLLCSAAALIGQPLPAVAFLQTPDGFRAQVDRCVGGKVTGQMTPLLPPPLAVVRSCTNL